MMIDICFQQSETLTKIASFNAMNAPSNASIFSRHFISNQSNHAVFFFSYPFVELQTKNTKIFTFQWYMKTALF